jgi:transcription elongation factor Elf1
VVSVDLLGQRKRRDRRIERLEISLKTHRVFSQTFACPTCAADVTATVRYRMTYDGTFCPYPVVAFCPSGHAYEYSAS